MQDSTIRAVFWCVAIGMCFVAKTLNAAEKVLATHAEIDRLIAARAEGPLAALAPDAEFVRRVWLDFAGTIPSATEVRSFLADTDPNKRTQLIDRLLASPDYPRRMQEVVSVMWLDRREGKAISDDAWNGWLREAFAANRPWNELVQELLATDGTDDKSRPAIRFFADGGRTDPHLLTQDVARIFLGMNWQCSQCHNHPVFEDYKQAHYFGMYAFLNPSRVYTDKQNQVFLVEGVTKSKIDFVSVFMPDEKQATAPKLLENNELEIPPFVAGQEFTVKPKDGHPGVPNFRPRLLLASQLTAASNRQFTRNTVNRFWHLLMGRGLVHPLDLHHAANPPSHPELLELLTDEFIAHRFDLRWLLRELALSDTYQRSSVRIPNDSSELRPAQFRVALPRPLSAEQLARALAEATGQRAKLDTVASPADSKFTYKDYVNGRLPPPENWKEVLMLFGATFGHPAGQPEVDFRPSVEQSLFLENDRLLKQWLDDSQNQLVDRLATISGTTKFAEEAFLTILARPPDKTEIAEITQHLQSTSDRRLATIDLCRALLTSSEFRLNH